MDVRQKTIELDAAALKLAGAGNDGARLAEGIAAEFTAVVTTNKEDRDHDILEPAGAVLDSKMPLLWQHDPSQPIGKYAETIERDSDKIIAKYQVADTPLGRDAAALLKLGVLRISHGFRPLEFEPRKGGSGGYHIKRFEMVETSLVSIPANTDAQVLSLSAKSFESPAIRQWVKGLTMTTQTPPAENKAGTFSIDEIKNAVSEGVVAAFATIAKGSDGAAAGTKGSGPTPTDLLKAAGGGKPDVTVKSVAARYSTETRELKHFKSGEKVRDASGNRPKSISELNFAKAGAFLKTLAAKAGLGTALDDQDRELMELAYAEKWCGEVGNQYAPELDGMRAKTILSDSVSGGTNVVPFWFDADLITFPLLTGELFPMVDLRNVPRGNTVHAGSMQNPTVNWNTAEGTDMPLFDTSSLIAAVNSSIFNVTCAIEVGRDFLADSPADVGRALVGQVGEKLASELDRVIAAGNGTSEPTGIATASGTTTVHSANGTGGPAVVADYSGLLFGIGKQYRTAAMRCAFLSNDTTYQRSRAVRIDPHSLSTTVNQTPLLSDVNSFNEYRSLGFPHKINNSLGNSTAIFAAMAKYRMYRRLGFEIRWITESAELARRNTALLVVRGRFGGQPIDGGACAVQPDQQS
jgi:HK97 family phage major capsid protein/HK97 family phage prohead protease